MFNCLPPRLARHHGSGISERTFLELHRAAPLREIPKEYIRCASRSAYR